MATPKGIQERLYERADAELEKSVGDVFSRMAKDLDTICLGEHASWAEIEIKIDGKITMFGFQVMTNKLRDAATEKLRKKYREEVVKEFMEKVDTLHDQIDELRDEIRFD